MTEKETLSSDSKAALRLAAIVESSMDAIIANSIEGIITDWNPAAENMYGYSAEEAIGQSIAIIAPEGRGGEVLQNIRQTLRGERARRLDVVRRHKDGTLFNASMSVAVLRDEQGEAFGVSAIHRDVTEQARAAVALREREAQLQLVADNIPVRVAYIDNSNVFRFVNPSYAEWQGYSQDEIIGIEVPELRGPEWYEIFRPFAEKSLTGEMSTFDGERELEDGRKVQFSAINAPHFDDEGNVLGYFVLIMDRTEQVEREEQLRQAQKMEAVGQLTGGIAHEFNNLLMVVIGNLELTLDRTVDEDATEFLSSAMTGALRGAELTKQLLAFSRKQILNVDHVNLNELVENMGNLLRRTLGETISVRTSLTDDPWLALADAGQVEAALLNLSLNARDAMPQGGQIIISTSNETLGAERLVDHPAVLPGDYTLLELADSGTGITQENLDRVFEPFFTTKDVGQGTGLGLSMVHGFVEQSGGFVDIKSEIGRGAKVQIYLPRADTAADHSVETGPLVPIDANIGATVLVVEDDSDVRKLVVLLLTELGCVTIEAADGETALAQLRAHPEIDVLFTDVVLPGGISGADVANEARDLYPGLRLILTSGYPEGEIGDVTGQDGNRRFISKPYRKNELAKLFADVLEIDPGG